MRLNVPPTAVTTKGLVLHGTPDGHRVHVHPQRRLSSAKQQHPPGPPCEVLQGLSIIEHPVEDERIALIGIHTWR